MNAIRIPKSMRNIYHQAFHNCSSLKDVYYNGSEADWKKIQITTDGAGAIIKATKHYAEKTDILQSIVSDIPEQQYTGKELNPSFTVSYSGSVLVEGLDYTVSYNNNVNPGTATVTITGKGNYTGTIVCTFEIVKKTAGLYDDVPETSGWRYEAIKYVKDHGIMNGISGTNNFAPDESITRAMFATIIYRMSGSPGAAYSPVFSDVPAGNYYSAPVCWANQEGIINGYSGTGRFGTMDNITRQDMATIMFRYAGYRGLDTSARASLSRFPDADKVSGYAQQAVSWAVANGIINGRSNTGELDPRGNATRVESAAIIMRFMQKYGL